ncbi:MAG TPA: ATP-binding protein [Chitinophagaceae bacterium]|nr:ATP-binding protein [Chitinophagaceae bacterium]
MLLEFILAMVIIRYLRTYLKKENITASWDRQLIIALAISIGLFVMGSVFKQLVYAGALLLDILLLYIMWTAYNTRVFLPLKPAIYAVLPYVVVSVVANIVPLLSRQWADDIHEYSEMAKLFAVIWMLAMWFITKKQRKAIETERLRAQEKEKQYALTEAIKSQLEIQVAERTAALTQQKEELQQALTELQSTQAQLIQSEKMASLGELTAGIAHEIQNPLNFVNNFSEVNTELMAEMKTAIDSGDMEEVKAIADDIIANEQKINYHGKRADAIVKGMLQHSRSSGGQKEPTDINALADEYLRLAYHGLRAKDKSFAATMKTDFDESIGKINVIPQDLGRVILNLITNAFYVVAEKKRPLTPDGRVNLASKDYVPTVTVSTKKTGNKVEIKVADNGNGIPAHILDKIFQPFFTTKPTGQGTGLGLSMSYDIVTKGHGGELKVSTKENEGSVFTILLPLQN